MIQAENKKIIKITEESIENRIEPTGVSQEQMQREVDYFRAERLLNTMLQKGIISVGEFNKITALNRRTFFPFLAEIMPLNR